MKLVSKTSIDELCPQDSHSVKYHSVPKEEEWRIALVKDIVDIINKVANLDGFYEIWPKNTAWAPLSA